MKTTSPIIAQEDIEAAVARDAALLKRIAQRDAAAFHEFHQLHYGLIFATVSHVLNDQQDAEDILQDVMIALWQKAHLYEPSKGKPLTWVTTMARNRAIDRIRAKQRRSRLYDDFESEHKVSQPEFEPSASENLDVQEQGQVLRRAMRSLTDDQREALQLAYFSGLSQSEVAKKLREPLGTVKARIRRGVNRLESLVRERL